MKYNSQILEPLIELNPGSVIASPINPEHVYLVTDCYTQTKELSDRDDFKARNQYRDCSTHEYILAVSLSNGIIIALHRNAEVIVVERA